jgi:hypothetical protein
MITLKSKIEKGSIRLPRSVGLPDGTRVIVRIEPVQTSRAKLKTISDLSGAWSKDQTIIPIFEEIDRQRHAYFGREVRFE